MRRVLAVLLVGMVATLGVPLAAAQAPASGRAAAGTISGEAMDAGGRPVVNQRVELVQSGVILQSTTTGPRGEWAFVGVAPGDYIVRLVVNGQVTGIRVALGPGQAVTDAVIVAPSAAAPSAAFLAALPLLASIAIVTGIAAAVITVIVVTAS
jgi:hypothetical protein